MGKCQANEQVSGNNENNIATNYIRIVKELRRMRIVFIIAVILVIILAMISTFSYDLSTKCQNENTAKGNASGRGNLKLTLLLFQSRINDSDENNSLTFFLKLQNIGDTDIRVIPPMLIYTYRVSIKDSQGKGVFYNWGDALWSDLEDRDTIVLDSPQGQVTYINASETESHFTIYLTLSGIYRHPGNYAFAAAYSTYDFDKGTTKDLNKITLDYWHGNLTSNSVTLQAY
jgi:hypothetical protein